MNAKISDRLVCAGPAAVLRSLGRRASKDWEEAHHRASLHVFPEAFRVRMVSATERRSQ